MRICSSKCRSRPDCQCSYHLSVTEGKIIQLVVTNMGSSDGHDGISFPLHLPGRQFYVVKIGWPEYQEESNFLQSINPDLLCSGVRCVGRPFSNKTWATGSVSDANLLRPPLKDTVIVPVGGYVVLRFVAENPGWWLAETTVEQLQV